MAIPRWALSHRCNLHGACGGKDAYDKSTEVNPMVAICTGRAEKPNVIIPPEKNPRKFMQTYCIFIHLGV